MNPSVLLAVLFPVALFVVETASAQAADPMAALTWKARPVVVFGDDPGEPRFRAQIAALEAKSQSLADYDIKIVPVGHADAALRTRLGVPAQGFAVVLVGKDGGVKESWRQPVDPSRIFAAIDTMPMRRDEVKAKRGGSR